MRIYSIVLIIGLISCNSNESSIEGSNWQIPNTDFSIKIDSALNASTHGGNIERKYQFEQITKDCLIYKSKYKDSIVTGGYFRLINANEAIFCDFKIHPNRSGTVDWFTYLNKEHTQKTNNTDFNTTKIILPHKKGRYVLEFLGEGINNTRAQDRLYKFKSKQLKVESSPHAKELTKNKYEFYFENSDKQIPQIDLNLNYDSILHINPDSIFVLKMEMNTFSHHKIYEYDTIRVRKDAEYFRFVSVID